MTDVVEPAPGSWTTRIARSLSGRGSVLRAYFSAVSGSAGRLVFSLLYFIALANTLSISDFGLFATASGAGVMLSRLLAFGFMSPLYRAASVKPRLIGTFTGGFLLMSVLSLPVLAVASALVYAIFFGSQMSPLTFALIIASEALLWRPFEAVVIVNNGLGRFGVGAMLVICATALRSIAAAAFAFSPDTSLADWTFWYLGANLIILAVSAALFYPKQRIRFQPKLYWRRLSDSVTVAAAEVLFYLQSEFDKLLVLALGGPALAGIYAIVMRLIDLTAIPIRAFSMMLVQKMMRTPHMLKAVRTRAMIEGGIFFVSTLALAAMAVVLHFFPNALGRNVSEAAPLVGLALLIPGFRNLIEYQAELLYARGQTILRIVDLVMLAVLKAILLTAVIKLTANPSELIWWLNGGFAGLYVASALFVHSAIRLPGKTF